MKLYTEEQVMIAYTIGNNDGLNGILKLYTKDLSLTPIEIPTDEEIDNEASNYIENGSSNSFRSGAKWMRDKIQKTYAS